MILRSESAIVICHRPPAYDPSRPTLAQQCNVPPGHFYEMDKWLDDNAPRWDGKDAIDPDGDLNAQELMARELSEIRRGMWAFFSLLSGALSTSFPDDCEGEKYYEYTQERDRVRKEIFASVMAGEKRKTAKPVKR